MTKPRVHILVECDLCDQYHPEPWHGDCRDKRTRYETPEEYCEREGVDRKHVAVQPFLLETEH